MNRPCEAGDRVRVGRTEALVESVIPLGTYDGWTGHVREGDVPSDWNVLVTVTKAGRKAHWVGQPTSFKPSRDKITVVARD